MTKESTDRHHVVDFDAAMQTLRERLVASQEQRTALVVTANNALTDRRLLLDAIEEKSSRELAELLHSERRLLRMVENMVEDLDDSALRLLLRVFTGEASA